MKCFSLSAFLTLMIAGSFFVYDADVLYAVDDGINVSLTVGTSSTSTPTSTPTTTNSGGGGGSSYTIERTAPLEIESIKVTTTENSIIVEWTTNRPTKSRVLWGKGDEYEGGSIAQTEYSTSHRLFIEGLVADTRYRIRIYSSDVRGEELIIDRTIRTQSLITKEDTFVANVAGIRVLDTPSGPYLAWKNPYSDSSVRVLRSEGFPSRDPLEGKVVYEGKGSSFLDLTAPREGLIFYTFYTFKNSLYSSGAVAGIVRTLELVKESPTETNEEGSITSDIFKELILDFPREALHIDKYEVLSSVVFTQYGQEQRPHESHVYVEAKTPFTFSIDKGNLPDKSTALVTFIVGQGSCNDTEQILSTFLIAGRDSKEIIDISSRIPELTEPGEYTYLITIFDHGTKSSTCMSSAFSVVPETTSSNDLLGVFQKDILSSLLWLVILIFFLWIAGRLLIKYKAK